MFIKDMFVKNIDRNIQDVIKAISCEVNEFIEVDEYVVTKEILESIKNFIRSYKNTYLSNNDEIGFWISGFFGSGKSHFLKILYYILKDFAVSRLIENNQCLVLLKEDFEFLSSINKEVILFNIDSKNRKNDSILDIFVNEFNFLRGFSKNYGFICEIEEQLYKDNLFESFKNYFYELSSIKWEVGREEFYLHKENFLKALSFVKKIEFLKAEEYFLDVEKNYKINIEKFVDKVSSYVKSKGDNYTLTFMIDEVSQFISDDVNKMLNLQTIVEELSIKCLGRVFVVVTSHVDITSITNNKKYDFSKIQGRFKTKINLSSVNIDEVLYKRLLLKQDMYRDRILKLYNNKEFFLKNILNFDIISDFDFSKVTENDFVSAYPFLPYQVSLLRDSIQFMIKNNVISEDVSRGERSIINFFQNVLIKFRDYEINKIVPFYMFYDSVYDFIDYNHQYIFSILNENKNINDFDIKVMKTLFLIKYIPNIVPTINTISSLMIDDINLILDIKTQINDSLLRLIHEGFVNNDGDKFYFLSKVERDVNYKILKTNINVYDIKEFLCNEIFNEIMEFSKVKYNNKILFSFNQYLDEINYKVSSRNLIGIKVFTTSYDENFDIDSLRVLSSVENDVILYIDKDKILIEEINLYLKLEKFLKYNKSNLKSEFEEILNEKEIELKNRLHRIKVITVNAIKNSFVFVNGERIGMNFSNVNDMFKNSIITLISCRFNKFNYISKFVDNSKNLIEICVNDEKLDEISKLNGLFINELNDFINEFECVKFSDLSTHFKNIPYGFGKNDVLLGVIYLIKCKNVICNYEINEIIEKISHKNFLNNLEIRKVNEISLNDFLLCKKILGEIFNKKYLLNNFGEFYFEAIEDFNNFSLRLNEIKKIAFEKQKYPAKYLINSIDEFLNKIVVSSQNEFLNIIKENNNLINMFEGFEEVYNFYTSVQLSIFNDAIISNELFIKDKNFIDNELIYKTSYDIEQILINDNPYSMISKLKVMVKKFYTIHKEILDKSIEEVNFFIDKEIMGFISLDLGIELKEKLSNCSSLFDVYGIKMEGIFLKDKNL